MNLLFPAGLALGALAVPLIGLYFLRIRRQRVRVPSLLLWQEVAKVQALATPFERFRKSLLLLLQLLLLLLLTLAFARPFLEDEFEAGRSLVLVVDVSASMGSEDGTPTRLDSAVAEARRAVSDLGTGDEVMLLVSGPATDVVVPFTQDKHLIEAALAELHPTGAQGSLREGIELAASLAKSRPGVEIVVLSDGGGADLGEIQTGDANVRYVPMGTSNRNAGIVALDLRRSPTSDLDRQLFVTVEEFGDSEVGSTVEVYLDGKVVGLRTEKVLPGAPVSMVFDLPAKTEGTLRVHLESEGDLLPADDDAYAVVSMAAERDVLLVNVDRLTARALQADPRFRLKVAPPAAITPEMLASYDAVVFGSTVPEAAKGHNVMVLGPYDGGPASFGKQADSPRILGWRRTHPVMRFVEWDGVVVARAKALADQGGLVSLVEADIGPLVLAGERDGGRWVQFGFLPLESDLPLRIAWPVLVLNSLGWLTEESGDTEASRIVAAGTPFVRRVPDGLVADGVTVTGPDGEPRKVDLADGVLRVRDTSDVGIYTLDAGALSTTFAANLLAPRESAIAPQDSLSLAAGVMAPAEAKIAGRKEIWRELSLVAIAVLMLEWFAWNRRKYA